MSQDSHQNAFGIVCGFMPGLRLFTRYKPSWLRSDLGAGLSVAAIALPVGIAYADLAGVPPVIGIYSAIFPLLVYALFGSSRQLMTGPDAATCIIVAASLAPLAGGDPQRYLGLTVMLTLMTGILYVIAGLSRLGFIANFLSLPILTGYLNGIALIIIVGQFQKLLGYPGEADDFFPKLVEVVDKLDQSHLPTVGLGIGLLVMLVVLRRLVPKIPAPLIVVMVGIAAVTLFDLDRNGVAVLGSVPAGLPTFHIMAFEPGIFGELLFDAAGIALVSFTSGVLTAKSFARRRAVDRVIRQYPFVSTPAGRA
jgi:MFS superfamily sulfate permease-like transporter